MIGRKIRVLLLVSLVCFGVASGLMLYPTVNAQGPTASVLHPTFSLLDGDGNPALDTGNPVSAMATCGTCHDSTFIAEHSVHTDAGMSLVGNVDDPREWVNGGGWYGGWNAINYPSTDLTTEKWVQEYGWRHVGGGPAAEVGVEMNCFLCHLPQADNAGRVRALQSGAFAWASTATLGNTGIVDPVDDGWRLNPDAFDDNGDLLREHVTIGAPRNENCGFCHGVVDTTAQVPLSQEQLNDTQWQTLISGQVFAPERINTSGLNLQDKRNLARSWDVHAERVVDCMDCHYSLNNPIFYVEPEASRPDHLAFDPRRMDYDDFLLRPLHQFANGGEAYVDVFPAFARGARDCASCHDAAASHEWLEYAERHINTMACETCHVPMLYAPALAAVDWTVIDTNGEPRQTYRGVDPDAETLFITGYSPVLLPDGDDRLAPHNVVSAWYWVYGDPAQPVALNDLEAVFLDGERYDTDIIELFDANDDGVLGEDELILDSDEKIQAIETRLRSRGLDDPRITAESEAYAIHHGVTHGEWATRDCSTCHTEDSRLNAAFTLSGHMPGGVQPTLISGNLDGELAVDADGTLRFTPSLAVGDSGLYVLGHHSLAIVDMVGALIFVASALGVMLHAGLRLLTARQMEAPHEPELREVYMYSIYERQWHWLQTVVIFGLIFTGVVIHKPDLFGMFSFRGMVLVHNALALLMIVNAALAAFYHLASGEIRQFLPEPRGFFGQMFAQARYYAYGIFRGEPHPFEKTRNRKMNPIQQMTYFGLLNVLLPLQVITGVLMWGAQRFPVLTNLAGGLPLLAPVHTLGSWLLATFIVVHAYMTTTGHTPLANLRAMIFGWDEVEVHHEQPSAGD